MNKLRKNLLVAGLAVVACASAGAAIAANRPTAKDEQKAVIDDAAKQLGVAPAKLQSALQQALVNRVEQAVKDGRLTRAQADEMIKRIQAGDLPLGGPGFGRGGGRGGFGGRGFGHHGAGPFGDISGAVTTYLGLTEDQLRTARQAGKSLADIAKEKNKSTDGLKKAMLAAVTKSADAAVTAGKLTKAQRDALIAKVPAWLDHEIAVTHTGRRHGDGFGGPGGPPPGDPVAPGGGTGTGTNDGAVPFDGTQGGDFQTA
jgi:hypothetical protein